MAIGFGTTLGQTGLDRIVTPQAIDVTQPLTFFFVAKRNGAGGGNLGRVFDCSNVANSSTSAIQTIYSASNSRWELSSFNTSNANTSFGASIATATGIWSPIAWRCNRQIIGAANNNTEVEVFLAGVKQTATRLTTTTGTPRNPVQICLGNVDGGALDRNFNGQIAHAAIWQRALRDAEIRALGSGLYLPSDFPDRLIYYVAGRNNFYNYSGQQGTVTGCKLTAEDPAMKPLKSKIFLLQPAVIVAPTQKRARTRMLLC